MASTKLVENEKEFQAKFKRFSKKKVEIQENTLFTNHRLHWFKEFHKLKKERATLEAELQIEINKSNSELKLFQGDYEVIEDSLEDELSSVEKLEIYSKMLFEPILLAKISLLNQEPTEVVSELITLVKSKLHMQLDQLSDQELTISKDLENYKNQDFENNELFSSYSNCQLNCSNIDEFADLERLHFANLEKLKREFRDSISELGLDNADLNGGWSEIDHFKFKCIITQYTQSVKNKLLHRLMLEFPEKTPKEISAHIKWFSTFKLHSVAISNEINDHERRKESRKIKLSKECELEELKLDEKLRKERLALKMEIEVSKRHSILEKLKLKANEEKAYRETLENELKLQAAEWFRAQEGLKNALRTEQKKLLEKYHATKQAELQIETEKYYLAVQEHEIEIEKNRQYNNVRVQIRTAAYLSKEKQRAALIERKRNEQIKCAARLEALRQTVRDQLVVENEPDRFKSETASFLSRLDSNDAGSVPLRAPLVQVHGYSDETLMQDQRFKLGIALREKGLLDTHAGARAFMSEKPRTNPRLDNFTSRDSIFHLSNTRNL